MCSTRFIQAKIFRLTLSSLKEKSVTKFLDQSEEWSAIYKLLKKWDKSEFFNEANQKTTLDYLTLYPHEIRP